MGQPKHVVAIVGGAVAGSEAARVLAEQGVEVVVFEQNARPYGKIEDGLPIWHDQQRIQEYGRIAERLTLPGVHFVPKTTLGRDLNLRELIDEWGFSAVLLANGAWRDRMLPVEGASDFVDKGLVLQNSLVYWFNHYREKTYSGPQYAVPDEAVVFGGGLASIDVVKILMLETVGAALSGRGIDVDVLEMEKKGIAATLDKHSLSLEQLGLKGCLLYYRRRKIDMPLAEMPDNVTPERMAKVEKVRAKIIDLAMKKYLFRFQERTLPKQLIVESGKLVGVTCVRTEVVDGRAKEIPDGAFDVRAPLFVSSIGSVPDRLPDVEQRGEYYRFKDWDTGALEQYPRVYGLGNVVTGKGNIRVSRKHGAFVSKFLLEHDLADTSPLDASDVDAILERTKSRQAAVGYPGDYTAWIEQVTPADLM